MTDTEIAEEYIRENVCNKERVWGSQSVCSDERIRECKECGNFCYFARINRESYLAGLAESRKENAKLKVENSDLKNFIQHNIIDNTNNFILSLSN